MQRVFSAKMASSGDPAYSAEKAGYAFPVVAGTKLMNNPDVRAKTQKTIEHALHNVLTPLATARLEKILRDDSQKGSTHVAASKVVLTWYEANRATMSQEDLADLPADQIRALLGEAKRALEARRNHLLTIEHEPAPAELLELEPTECAQDAPDVFE